MFKQLRRSTPRVIRSSSLSPHALCATPIQVYMGAHVEQSCDPTLPLASTTEQRINNKKNHGTGEPGTQERNSRKSTR